MKCDACALTEGAAPVRTRWLLGVALVLCQECWLSPNADHAAKIDALVKEHALKSDGARRDHEESALLLVEWAEHYIDAKDVDDRRLTIEVAAEEHARLRKFTQWFLPHWMRIRAGLAAHIRGLAPFVDEDHPAAKPFFELERDAYERAAFGGFCRAWDIPVEFHDWVFDSAREGKWLPVRDGPHRPQPRVGPYSDLDRRGGPPCITWGRHTPRDERGSGRWVNALNKRRGWSAPKKAIWHVDLAPPTDRDLHQSLLAEVIANGLPSKPTKDRALDREELLYRLHCRMCPKCRNAKGKGTPLERGRASHRFMCFREDGNLPHPQISWLKDQLRKPWNDTLLFQAGLSVRPTVRTH